MQIMGWDIIEDITKNVMRVNGHTMNYKTNVQSIVGPNIKSFDKYTYQQHYPWKLPTTTQTLHVGVWMGEYFKGGFFFLIIEKLPMVTLDLLMKKKM